MGTQLNGVQNKKKESNKTNDMEMCYYFCMINDKYEHDIINQHFVRSYIDLKFESTKKYYYIQCLLFTITTLFFVISILSKTETTDQGKTVEKNL